MQKLSLFTLLILLSWIPLSVRSQVSSDTSRCYGVSELRKIALALTKGQHTDSLLQICDSVCDNQKQIILLKDQQVTGLKSESTLKEFIISRKNQEIQTIQLNLDKTKRKLTWTKIGWVSTTLLLLTSTGYFIIH